MVTEFQVVNELETYFKSIGLIVQRNKHFSLPRDIEWHSYVEIDLMIRKGDKEIPIEVKANFKPSSIQKGIGQALSYLIFFKESWLAIPYRAVGLMETILRKTKLQNFRVLDWENKVLYEHYDGKVIGNKL